MLISHLVIFPNKIHREDYSATVSVWGQWAVRQWPATVARIGGHGNDDLAAPRGSSHYSVVRTHRTVRQPRLSLHACSLLLRDLSVLSSDSANSWLSHRQRIASVHPLKESKFEFHWPGIAEAVYFPMKPMTEVPESGVPTEFAIKTIFLRIIQIQIFHNSNGSLYEVYRFTDKKHRFVFRKTTFCTFKVDLLDKTIIKNQQSFLFLLSVSTTRRALGFVRNPRKFQASPVLITFNCAIHTNKFYNSLKITNQDMFKYES